MTVELLYCSACDRNVRVRAIHEPAEGTAVDPSAFACLDCGERCTGSLCAITELPPAQMKSRLERSGLAPA